MDRVNTSEPFRYNTCIPNSDGRTLQYSLVFVPGLVTGRLFDMGVFRVPLTIASVFLVVATMLVAECKTYWQFLLCQGFAVGVRILRSRSRFSPVDSSVILQIGCGIIFGPLLGVVAHWFKKRKGLALGWTAVGSSLGGTLFPIAARNLIQSVGLV